MSAILPIDVYGVDDTNEVWVPHATRSKALTLAAPFLDSPVANRCWLRVADDEEREMRGWEEPGPAVLICRSDHPGAIPGWHVREKTP